MILKRLLPLVLSVAALFVVARPGHSQTNDDPQKDDFIEVESEPVPLVPIGSLVIYPDSARRAEMEGRVVVEALIDKQGNVAKVEILKSTTEMDPQAAVKQDERKAPKILEDEAVRAIKSAKFTPAMNSGKPVKVWCSFPITFQLTSHEERPGYRLSPSNPVEPQAQKQSSDIGDFVYVTEEPLPLQSIEDSIRYPVEAKRLAVEGDVKARILIEADGHVSKVLIDKSDSKLLEAEASRVLQSTKFSSAKDGDKPIRVWIQQTVHFRLPRSGSDTPQKTK